MQDSPLDDMAGKMPHSTTAQAHGDHGAHCDDESRFDGDEALDRKGATTADHQDMVRMGKSQETRRSFRLVTILGFCMVRCSLRILSYSSAHVLGDSLNLGGHPGYVRLRIGEWRHGRSYLGVFYHHGRLRFRRSLVGGDGINVSSAPRDESDRFLSRKMLINVGPLPLAASIIGCAYQQQIQIYFGY